MLFRSVVYYRIILFSALFLVSVSGRSQALCSTNKKAIAQYTEADNYRVRGQYREAMALLEAAIERDKAFCEAYLRLAQIHRSRKDLPAAVRTLEMGMSVTATPAKMKLFWFDLGELLLLSGDYGPAADYLRKFLAAETVNKVRIADARRWLANCEFGLAGKTESSLNARPLGDTVNCFAMQYFPVLTADERFLFFTRRNGKTVRDTEDIVVSSRDASGNFSVPVSISPSINTPENEGTCSVSADGRQIIFTSCRGRAGFGN